MHVYNAYKHMVQTLVLTIQGYYSCMYIMHISIECKLSCQVTVHADMLSMLIGSGRHGSFLDQRVSMSSIASQVDRPGSR